MRYKAKALEAFLQKKRFQFRKRSYFFSPDEFQTKSGRRKPIPRLLHYQ